MSDTLTTRYCLAEGIHPPHHWMDGEEAAHWCYGLGVSAMSTAPFDRAAMLALCGCPQWCTRKAEHRGLADFHDGPSFGGVSTVWQPFDKLVDDDQVWAVMLGDMEQYGYTSTSWSISLEEARRLASDLLAAAEWLEAQR
jgi:hypothetical protein